MNDVYKTPNSNVEQEVVTGEVRRGGFLTAFIFFGFVTNIALAITYIVNPDIIKSVSPDAPDIFAYIYSGGGFLNIVFISMVWFWKRVGVFGFGVMSLLTFASNLYLGVPISGSIIGLIGPVILILLVKSKWSRFV